MPPKKIPSKNDYDEDVDAIYAVYDEQEKKDFKEAIAASLNDDEELEDTDLKKAIAASLNDLKTPSNGTRKKTPPNQNISKKGTLNISKKGTRKKFKIMAIEGAILSNAHQVEKHTLESQLPVYLNGAKVDIIEGDGNCFFRSITRQLRAYRFIVPNEYQGVRNLVADYIENTTNKDITQIFNPTYTLRPEDTHTVTEEVTQKEYAERIRGNMWGSDIEAIAITNGCLATLTNNQDVCVIIYIKIGEDKIIKQNGLLDPHGLPIRLLFVGRNHYHRIYFDDIDIQSNIYPEELKSGQPINPVTGMTRDEEIRQIEAYTRFTPIYSLRETAHTQSEGVSQGSSGTSVPAFVNEKRLNKDASTTQINDSSSKLACPTCTYLNDVGTINCEICKTVLNKADLRINDEWGMSENEKEEQLKAIKKYNNQKIVIVNEESDEYGILSKENLGMLFMIMGYQNGQTNLLYKSVWNESELDGIQTFTGDIYIPKEVDINNRKYTRYPNPSMLNINGKTIVNISLHRWANIWDEDNNFPLGTVSETLDSGSKLLLIQMTDAHGVEEVLGTEDADFTSILLNEHVVSYMRHGKHGMSFSPDTGVIALDDKEDNPSCIINVRDPMDDRTLMLKLNFHRIEYIPPSDKVSVYDMFGAPVPAKKTPGGKPRQTRKLRKQRRRRQTKRRR